MIKINKHTLPNGLRLVHSLDNTTEMVALNVLYDVGSKDEHPDHTGFAHLFEHLMFGGSVNIPDYDTPIQEAGGENNAWTSNDMTNYYLTLPKQNIEIGFWLESDRMLSLDFNPKSLETQRQVVIEEFKETHLNEPYGDSSLLLRPLAYTTHPYRWATIGKEIAHIEQVTLEEVKAFFYRFYAPNNAILSITGNIEFEEALRLTEKWFASIPNRQTTPRKLTQEPQQMAYRQLEVERDVPLDVLYVAFHMCERTHPDYFAYDILSDLLASGHSSRLHQRLVKEQNLFSSIDAYIDGSVEAGLFYILGKPAAGVSLVEAEAVIFKELECLKTALVSEFELEKVKNKFESTQLFSNISYLNLATNLAYFELISEAEDINLETQKQRSIEASKLQEIANTLFVKSNCSALHYKSTAKA